MTRDWHCNIVVLCGRGFVGGSWPDYGVVVWPDEG